MHGHTADTTTGVDVILLSLSAFAELLGYVESRATTAGGNKHTPVAMSGQKISSFTIMHLKIWPYGVTSVTGLMLTQVQIVFV